MKKLQLILICITVFTAIGCKEQELMEYSATNNIYFEGTTVNRKYQPLDTDYFSFGYIASHIQDTVIQLHVLTTGLKENFKREYDLHILPGTTLEEGKDYEFLNKNFSIKPGQVRDTVLIKVFRTQDMTRDTLSLSMELKSNEFFESKMFSREEGYFDRFDLLVDDIAGTPWFWDPAQNSSASMFIGYLGNYSARKFQLMISQFSLNVEEVTKVNYRPDVLGLIAWANGMQAYLNEMTFKNTPVLEEDGTPMKMGDYVQ